MKKIFLTALILLTLTFAGCGDEKKSDNVDGTKKVFVIGIDDEFAPMTFRDKNNQLVGFDIDMAKETAKRLGVTFEFKPIEWDNKKAEITSGNVDMIWSGCDIIDEYKKYMIFSKPYMNNRQIVLVKKNSNAAIRSVSDLAGKIVGTQSGSNSVDYINENEHLKKSFGAFETYTNFHEGFDSLRDGKIDALIVDEIAGRYEMNIHPDTFKALDFTVGPVTEFGIGFRKDNVELRNKIQVVFNELVKDGTAAKISEQWFDSDLVSFKK